MTRYSFVIDFDSTFINAESLDALAQIALRRHPDRVAMVARIQQITNDGMAGLTPFSQSLAQRLSLLNLHRDHVTEANATLARTISRSFLKYREFFKKYSDAIYIVSSGFRELIDPIVIPFGVREDHIHANELIYHYSGRVLGVKSGSILAEDQGKRKLVDGLNLPGEVVVIGDGISDFEIASGRRDRKFFAFTENVSRDSVVKRSKFVAPNLDFVLQQLDIPAEELRPFRGKALLLENIHPLAIERLLSEGFEVDVFPHAMTETELLTKIHDYTFVGLRSKTKLTAAVLAKAERLLGVGAFCIGTEQIAMHEATAKGIAVFNAPFSNTRSVVEMTLSALILLSRGLLDKNAKMHAGVWDKGAQGAHEVRGKKLGIVGYGNIGAQISILAEALGIDVYYYDIVEKLPLGTARSMPSLTALLAEVDMVTIHIDGRKTNDLLFNDAMLAAMQPGAIVVNYSRGRILDLASLAQHLRSGHLRGAAVDVFPEEPDANSNGFVTVLQGLPNVLLTPHIGGSTQEAQENIGRFVADRLVDFFLRGASQLSVNFPHILPPPRDGLTRLFHVHSNVPGVLAKINGLLGAEGINVEAQFLTTNQDIGYVITDVRNFNQALIGKLSEVPHTLRVRSSM